MNEPDTGTGGEPRPWLARESCVAGGPRAARTRHAASRKDDFIGVTADLRYDVVFISLLLHFVFLRFVYPFTEVLSEIRSEVTRKIWIFFEKRAFAKLGLEELLKIDPLP
jgi:hypothetical protein